MQVKGTYFAAGPFKRTCCTGCGSAAMQANLKHRFAWSKISGLSPVGFSWLRASLPADDWQTLRQNTVTRTPAWRLFYPKTGVSVAGISDGAQSIGFRTISVRITLQVLLTEAPKSLIAYWRQRHSVVVYASTNDHIFVPGPAFVNDSSHTKRISRWLVGIVDWIEA